MRLIGCKEQQISFLLGDEGNPAMLTFGNLAAADPTGKNVVGIMATRPIIGHWNLSQAKMFRDWLMQAIKEAEAKP